LLEIIERDQGLGQDPHSTTSASASEDESSDNQSSAPGSQASDTSTQQPTATATSSLGVDEPTDSASAQPEPSDLSTTPGQEGDEITTEPTDPEPEPSASDAEPTRWEGTLRAWKDNPGGDIGVHGSISVAQAALAGGIVDELRLVIAPSIAGGGRRLFDGLPPIRLKLIRSETSPTGYLLVDYRLIR
jgi:hypothetical protein